MNEQRVGRDPEEEFHAPTVVTGNSVLQRMSTTVPAGTVQECRVDRITNVLPTLASCRG